MVFLFGVCENEISLSVKRNKVIVSVSRTSLFIGVFYIYIICTRRVHLHSDDRFKCIYAHILNSFLTNLFYRETDGIQTKFLSLKRFIYTHTHTTRFRGK